VKKTINTDGKQRLYADNLFYSHEQDYKNITI